MHVHTHAAQSTADAHQRTFIYALTLTFGFAAIEAIAGVWANSLTLLGDAGHMATDGLTFGIAAIAAWIAHKPASAHHSYGFGRAEVMAALLNTLFMLAIVAAIVFEAVSRLRHPSSVQAPVVMLVGVIGILINFGIYWVLRHGETNLNLRASLLHVSGDLLGSLAALVSGVVIFFSGWFYIDPLLSLLVAALILISSLRLLHDTSHILLEGVPHGLDLDEIGHGLASVEGVRSVHDLHVWSLSSREVSLSAHVVIDDLSAWQEVLPRIRSHLQQTYSITHVTLQPEPGIVARVSLKDLGKRF